VGTAAGSVDFGAVVETWNGGTWTVQTTPQPPGEHQAYLSGVSCTTALCFASGYYFTSAGAYAPLVEESLAGAWTLQTAPDPPAGAYLESVSCSDSVDCTAVGEYGNFSSSIVERWNGTSWAIQTTPVTAFEGLSGVACPTASSCAAVGQDYGPMLAETWNGAVWSLQTLAEPAAAEYGTLTGVGCTTPTACTAVGWSYSSTLAFETWAERWDGTHWTLQSLPEPAGQTVTRLSGVACPSVVLCFAVGTATSNPTTGYANETVAEQWNGTTWSVVPTPNPSWAGVDSVALTAIGCTSSTACTAVGSSSGFIDGYAIQMPLSERWNGSSWAIQAVPLPSGAISSALTSVSCTGPLRCMAVGTTNPSTSGQVPQAAAWDGTAWTAQMLPVPAGAVSTWVTGVSCAAANACTAVGRYLDLSDVTLPLIERWNGSAWSIQQAPGGSRSTLAGVSCPSANDCIAVADIESGHMVDHWNGSAWKYQSTPIPPGSTNMVFAALSCPTATACMAVGFKTGTAAINITLTERYSA